MTKATPDEITIDSMPRQLMPGRETVLDITSDGESRKVSFGSRELQPEPPVAPTRAESDRRSHVFYDVPTAAAYLSQANLPGK